MPGLDRQHRRLLYACGVPGGIFLAGELFYATLEGRGLPLSPGYWLYTLLAFAVTLGFLVVTYRRLTTHTVLTGFHLALGVGWAAALLKLTAAGSIPFLNPFLWLSVPFAVLLFLQARRGLFQRVNHPVWCLMLLLILIASTRLFRRFWLYTSGVSVGESRRMAAGILTHGGWWLTGFTPNNLLFGLVLALGATGLVGGLYRLGIPLTAWIDRHRASGLSIVLVLLLATGPAWELTRESPAGAHVGYAGEASFSGSLPAARGPSPPIGELPNLVLVSIDTLRWDAVHGDPTRSPIPGALRRDSLAFTRLISTSGWTLPAHASLFSGRIPVEHGAVRFASRIRSDVPLYPQYLRRMGYRTAGFTDGVLVGKKRGFGRGHGTYREQPSADRVERYADFVPGMLEVASTLLAGTKLAFPVHYGIHDLLPADHLRRFRRNLDEAMTWVERGDPSRPFYLFLHSYQVHDYQLFYPRALRGLSRSRPNRARVLLRGVPLPSAERFTRSNPEHHRQVRALHHLYRQGIDPIRDGLRRLVQFLKERGEYHNTAIVILSDHGEGFSLDPRMLFHGKGQLGEVLLRVPMVVKPPRADPDPGRIEAPLQITDVFPLMGRLAGFEFPREPGVSNGLLEGVLADTGGRRFTRGSSQHQHRPGHGPLFFVRGKDYKVVTDRGRGVTRYYRVRTVPPGQRSVPSPEVPDPVREHLQRELRRVLSAAAASSHPYRPSEPKRHPELLRELQGMGYL